MNPQVGEIRNNRKRPQSAICTLRELPTIYKCIPLGTKQLVMQYFLLFQASLACGCHVSNYDLEVKGRSGVEEYGWVKRGLEFPKCQ